MPTVSGRVTTPAGDPLAGVHVYAWSTDYRGRPDTHTDAAGTWRLELPVGEWTVREPGRSVPVMVADDPVDTADADADGAGSGASLPGRSALAAALARRRAGEP